MARKLDGDLNCFADDSLEGKLIPTPIATGRPPQPLSQEWFRANPQWTTDRLMKLDVERKNSKIVSEL